MVDKPSDKIMKVHKDFLQNQNFKFEETPVG